MSLPALTVPSPSRRRVRPVMSSLLDLASAHRLHAALVLVALYRLRPHVVLDLSWPHTPSLVETDPDLAELLHWHGCRQRLDLHRAGASWSPSRRVFVDHQGRPYTADRADDVVGRFAAQVGLPPLTLGSLAHPCWTA